MDAGIIEETGVFSDSLKTDFILGLAPILKGIRYEKKEISSRIANISLDDNMEITMKNDIVSWIESIDL